MSGQLSGDLCVKLRANGDVDTKGELGLRGGERGDREYKGIEMRNRKSGLVEEEGFL